MGKVIGLLVVLSGLIWAQSFSLDMSHSRIGFSVKYMMMSKVYGQFDQAVSTLNIKEGKPSSVSAQITVDSISTNNQKRDAHLKSDDFFNAPEYPTISFVADRIEASGDGYVAIASLTMHGIKRQISIPFSVSEPYTNQKGQTRIAIQGKTQINRKDFGILFSKKMDNGGLVIDDFVNIELDLQYISNG